MILTLCRDCSDVFVEDDGKIIYRVDREQRIREPCMCCRKGGYDYEVRDLVSKVTTNVKQR